MGIVFRAYANISLAICADGVTYRRFMIILWIRGLNTEIRNEYDKTLNKPNDIKIDLMSNISYTCLCSIPRCIFGIRYGQVIYVGPALEVLVKIDGKTIYPIAN